MKKVSLPHGVIENKAKGIMKLFAIVFVFLFSNFSSYSFCVENSSYTKTKEAKKKKVKKGSLKPESEERIKNKFKAVKLLFVNKSTHMTSLMVFDDQCTEYQVGDLHVIFLDAQKVIDNDLEFNWVKVQINVQKNLGESHTIFNGWTNNYNPTFENPEWFFKIVSIEKDEKE